MMVTLTMHDSLKYSITEETGGYDGCKVPTNDYEKGEPGRFCHPKSHSYRRTRIKVNETGKTYDGLSLCYRGKSPIVTRLCEAINERTNH